MSEPIKKPDQNKPESYSPKIPKLINMMEERREENYPEAFTLTNKNIETKPGTNNVLPQTASFANAFTCFLEYTGQSYGSVYKYDNWRCDVNYTLADIITGYAMRPCCLAVTAEGIDRLYEVSGFSSRRIFYADLENYGKKSITGTTYIDPAKGEYMSEADMKELIKYTLCTLGQPVIMSPIDNQFFGGIIIGYKENGDILVTYGYLPNFISPMNAPPKIEEIKNWYNERSQIVILGNRSEAIPLKRLYREGLRQVRNYLKEGIYGGDSHYFDEWIDFLQLNIKEMIATVKKTKIIPGAQLFESDFPKDNATDQQILNYIYHIVDPLWCEMAERRYYIMHFFHQAAQHFPEEKEAMHEIENHFNWSQQIIGGEYAKNVGHDPVNDEAFENPDIRAEMANCVRKFREADVKGLEMVEKLLEHLNI